MKGCVPGAVASNGCDDMSTLGMNLIVSMLLVQVLLLRKAAGVYDLIERGELNCTIRPLIRRFSVSGLLLRAFLPQVPSWCSSR